MVANLSRCKIEVCCNNFCEWETAGFQACCRLQMSGQCFFTQGPKSVFETNKPKIEASPPLKILCTYRVHVSYLLRSNEYEVIGLWIRSYYWPYQQRRIRCHYRQLPSMEVLVTEYGMHYLYSDGVQLNLHNLQPHWVFLLMRVMTGRRHIGLHIQSGYLNFITAIMTTWGNIIVIICNFALWTGHIVDYCIGERSIPRCILDCHHFNWQSIRTLVRSSAVSCTL